MGTVTLLGWELYSEAEAARLLSVAPSTLHWWLDGGTYGGRTYQPVIRPESTGGRTVTWAEFMDAGLLYQYRKVHKVELSALRRVIDILRRESGLKHPLAHHTLYVGSGREILREVQERTELDPDLCLVAVANGQLLLTSAADAFVERVVWAPDDMPVGWRPHAVPDSPVRVSPEVRFGKPAIKGISTEVIWEHLDSGESEQEVADAFGLGIADVRWASSYELSARAGQQVA